MHAGSGLLVNFVLLAKPLVRTPTHIAGLGAAAFPF